MVGVGEWGTESCPFQPDQFLRSWCWHGESWGTAIGTRTLSRSVCRQPGVLPGCSIAPPFTQTHPGTAVTVLDLFDGRESLRPLWEQVQGFREAVTPIMAKAPEGVNLICYSQGRPPFISKVLFET